ncbi:MAG: uracil-DNA glycosylase [Firmicutes bacterium]|uniref:Uracil-DNA glycosylase n=1 Tax=Candidatus Gallilactobacillus intestinavium TaxID=2840838 RepID=A0A9D9E773_9LACO|nr:uracil-DNA glycosylase [Candidatus Gallilactobacillus intestinavium]
METLLTKDLIRLANDLVSNNKNLEGFVPGEGSLNPKFVLISEAPGAKEAELSHGFQGVSGKELDKWLNFINVSRKDIYLTGTVRSRPFKQKNGRKSDRKPNVKEIKDFSPLLDYELKCLKDKLLVTLGGTAINRLLGKDYKISKCHGILYNKPILFLKENHFEFTDYSCNILPLFHPSYVRRFPGKRDLVIKDLKYLKELLGN